MRHRLAIEYEIDGQTLKSSSRAGLGRDVLTMVTEGGEIRIPQAKSGADERLPGSLVALPFGKA